MTNIKSKADRNRERNLRRNLGKLIKKALNEEGTGEVSKTTIEEIKGRLLKKREALDEKDPSREEPKDQDEKKDPPLADPKGTKDLHRGPEMEKPSVVNVENASSIDPKHSTPKKSKEQPLPPSPSCLIDQLLSSLEPRVEKEEPLRLREVKRSPALLPESLKENEASEQELFKKKERSEETLNPKAISGDKELPSEREPDLINLEEDQELGEIDEFEVEGVIATRYSGKKMQLLVKWLGFKISEASWVMIGDCGKGVKKMIDTRSMKKFRDEYELMLANQPEKNLLGAKGVGRVALFNRAKNEADDFD